MNLGRWALNRPASEVWSANLQVHGPGGVLRQMNREGIEVARRTVERATFSDNKAPCPPDKLNRQFRSDRAIQLWVMDFNGVYKAELIHRRALWKTKDAEELATREWVSWFNRHCLLQPMGRIPPAAAEACDHRQLASQVTAVDA